MSTPRAVALGGHELAFDDELHRYTLDGREIPGVTTIIATVIRMPELERWREWVGTEEANRRRDEAADHGSLLHAAAVVINQELEDIPFDVEPAFAASYAAFTEWFETFVDEVIAIEQPVYDATWWYAGTPDLIARIKGRKLPCLVDYKTSSGIYLSHRLQTVAYRKPAVELLGHAIGDRLIVHIPRADPGKLSIHTFKAHQQDWVAWTNTCALYRWMRGVK